MIASRRNAAVACALLFALASHASAQAAVARVNFGSLGAVNGYTAYDPSALTGDQGFYTGTSSGSQIYSQHVWGENFSYKLPLAEGKAYNIKLHFSETYTPYCKNDGRVFTMSAGAKTVTVDTFKAVGCNTPHTVDISDVTPVGGVVDIKAVKVNVQNAFLSAVEAFEADGTAPADPTVAPTEGTISMPPSPIPEPLPVDPKPVEPTGDSAARVNFGSLGAIDGYTAYDASALTGDQGFYTGPSSGSEIYRQHVWGDTFSYNLALTDGKSYNVRLHFSETYTPYCKNEGRVFEMSAGAKTVTVDTFKAVGCNTPHTVDISDVTPSAGILVIKGVKVNVQNAFLSAVEAFEVGSEPVVPDGTASPSVVPAITAVPTPTMSAVPAETVAADATMTAVPTPTMSAVPAETVVADATMTAVPTPTMGAVTPLPTVVDTPAGSTVARVNFGSLGAVDGYAAADAAALTASGAYTGPASVPAVYRQHVFGSEDFTYTLSGLDDTKTYTVRLQFAEVFAPNCIVGNRVFAASAGSVVKEDIDVFAGAGACLTPYSLDFDGVASTGGELVVTLMKKMVENPMLSALEVFDGAPGAPVDVTPGPVVSAAPVVSGVPVVSVVPVVSTVPVPVPAPDFGTVVVDCGGGGAQDIPVAGTEVMSNAVPVAKTNNDAVYQTSRAGTTFTYSFDLSAGEYEVSLGFAEVVESNCADGKRVFDVAINGDVVLPKHDIFATVGCETLDYHTFSKTAVAAGTPLAIKFTGVTGLAEISYIRIRPSKIPCVPASTSGSLGDTDHAAHSVPGSYPPQVNANSPSSYVDVSGKGSVTVTLNAGGSHSHFFDAAAGINGKIEYYEWTNLDTGEFLSNDEEFSYDFDIGTHRLSLLVGDNSCTEDVSETSVTVSGSNQPGSYCYYYDNPGALPAVGGVGVGGESGPTFAAETKGVDYGFPTFSFDGGLFGVRCTFSLMVDGEVADVTDTTNVQATTAVAVDTGATGDAQVYLGTEIVDGPVVLSPGLNTFELVYLRTATGGTPKMTFTVDGVTPALDKLMYDQNMVVPVITTLAPATGPVAGDTSITVSGYGFYQRPVVSFGENSVQADGGFSTTSFVVKSPAAAAAGEVKVSAATPEGASGNELSFTYGSEVIPPPVDEPRDVEFKFEKILETDGSSAANGFATCIKIGVDGKLYMGTLTATVVVLEYNQDTLEVISRCSSAPLTDNNFKKDGNNAVRDILGIALDPRDPIPKPYVSTQTLFWFDRNRVDTSNTAAWRNGAIDQLVPGTVAGDADICLVYEKRIVSNIPVSNHDHGVNGLEFMQNGDLLIAVGSFTNSGLPGYKLGNYWEAPNSAAILRAKLSLGAGFDGTIAYTPDDNPKLAKITGGDVENFATGIRNPFNLVLHSTNNVYATDNSCNSSFGNTAETCDEDDDNSEYPTGNSQDWPGTVPHGSGGNQFSVSRPDKIVHVSEGSYYGHPNLNRGECAWVDPFDGKTGLDNPAPAAYKAPLDTLKSSIDGIVEYTADSVFGGALRGELIISSFNNGNTYRMGVNGATKTSGPSEVSGDGGLSVAMASNGDLLFPRINFGDIFVLRPVDAVLEAKEGPSVVAAVPFRHGKDGGSTVIIGGYNFGDDVTVAVGGKNCAVVKKSAKSVTCTVPAGTAGALVDVAVTTGGVTAVSSKGLWYMSV